MKRLILILLGATFIFFSCSKDEFVNPESTQGDQSILKKGNEKVPFSGLETFYAPGYDGDTTFLPNGKTLIRGITVTWLDETTAPLTSGLTEYDFNILWDGAPFASSGKFWGKGTLSVMTVVDGVPQGETLGTWDISFHGPITLEDGVFIFTANATGVGKTGLVKSMVCHTVYILDTSVGFYYTIDGHYIDKK